MSHNVNMPSPELARRMANAIRMLAVDAVEQAKSGHPGAPMGMADIAEVLWNRHLKHNPANPEWPDRFVLSNGHGSMLIYALLHLTGHDLPMDEVKRFRQLHSKTAGHPEVGVTPGVETTIATRVVSMPCTNLFDRQPPAYQEAVLPLALPTVAVEAAHPDFWRKYVGRRGRVIGIASFGESAPAKDLYQHFGITAEAVAQAVRELVRVRAAATV